MERGQPPEEGQEGEQGEPAAEEADAAVPTKIVTQVPAGAHVLWYWAHACMQAVAEQHGPELTCIQLLVVDQPICCRVHKLADVSGCLQEVSVPLRTRVEVLDFDGRSDARSRVTLIGHIVPRHLILIHGTAQVQRPAGLS